MPVQHSTSLTTLAYKAPKKLPRPRRRGHYQTGLHSSLKANRGQSPVAYRSGWEREVCLWLDACADVLCYEYEPVAIPYISNQRTGKVRHYYPDFIIHYTDGRKIVVEVKRVDKLLDPMVMKKTEAGKRWAEAKGMQYQIWSNSLIAQLKVINEMRVTGKAPRKKQYRKRK